MPTCTVLKDYRTTTLPKEPDAPASSIATRTIFSPIAARWNFQTADVYGDDILTSNTTIEIVSDNSISDKNPYERTLERRAAVVLLETSAASIDSKIPILGVKPKRQQHGVIWKREVPHKAVVDKLIDWMLPV